MRRIVLSLTAALAWAAAIPAAASPPPGADKWALIIGISRYQPPTKPTVGGAGDAGDMRDLLLRQGWPAGQVRVLSDAGATAADIRAGLAWLRDRSSERSYSVIHFSGHVKQMDGDRDRDGESLDEYLWAADNRFISDAELARSVRAIRGWVWVNLAGCEAAGFDDGIAAPNRLFTASSREVEKSYEMPDWANSVYVGLLVDRAVLAGQADFNRDGRVSVNEAFRLAAEQAPRITARQRNGPQHPTASGGGGTEWFLDAPAPAPAPAPSGGLCLLCRR